MSLQTQTSTKRLHRRMRRASTHSAGARAIARCRHTKTHPGFTIVELLVVIVVIAILATISVVVYSGIQERATEAAIKAELGQVARGMQIARVMDNLFPTQPSSEFRPSDNSDRPFNYYQRGGGSGFCADMYSTRFDDVAFHVSNTTNVAQVGLCSENPHTIGPSPPPPAATNVNCFAITNNLITNYYNTEGNVAGATACPRDVVIPGTVTGIGLTAFLQKQITSVIIPNSVTNIGNGAFQLNRLTSVTIPNSVTNIGNGAFQLNRLTSVTIPNSVTSIGGGAFESNQITSVTIPNSVTSIGQNAFFSNRLTSLTIPSSVTSIGSGAFLNNLLTSVEIGPSTTYQTNSFDPGVTVTRR